MKRTDCTTQAAQFQRKYGARAHSGVSRRARAPCLAPRLRGWAQSATSAGAGRAAAATCSLTGAATAWPAAVRRGSSKVAADAAATSAALTVIATTIPETNVPLDGAAPRTP